MFEGDLEVRDTNGYKDKIPAGGALILHFKPSADMHTSADVGMLLTQLLKEQEKRDKGGHFRWMQVGNVFHVIPTEVKDRDGNWAPRGSILDVAITLSKKERTGMEILRAIGDAVAAKGGAHINIGRIPNNVIIPYHGTPVAENETARNVLTRALDGISERLTWTLLFDPTGREYYLNILFLSDTTVNSATGKFLIAR
jgi:hypothetical protein